MTIVHTAHGRGEIVESETVRGRTTYKVAGDGFSVWLDETEINRRTAGQHDGRMHEDPMHPQYGAGSPALMHPSELEYDEPGNPDSIATLRRQEGTQYHPGEGRHQASGPAKHLFAGAESYLRGVRDEQHEDWVNHAKIHGYNPDDDAEKEAWLDQTDPYREARIAAPNFDFEPSDHTWDNHTTLPYNPEPQFPVDMFRHEQTISPDHKIDIKERLRPSDSRSFETREDEHEYPGPDPKLFAKGAGMGWTPGDYHSRPEDSEVDDPEEMAAWDSKYGPTPGYELPEEHRARPGSDAREQIYHEAPRDSTHPGLIDPESGERHGSYRPAGLSSKYADIHESADHFNDPVVRFRDDPHREIHRHGNIDISAGLDQETGDWMNLVEADKQIRTAAWKDVASKASRLKREGAVHVKAMDPSAIYASVDGDNGNYEVMILRGSAYSGMSPVKKQAIADWKCSCPWGQWAFKRKLTFVGRLCSHGYATYLTQQSHYMEDKAKKTRNKKGSRTAGADAFKSWCDKENGGHVDLDAADNYLSTQEEPVSKEEAQSVLDYVQTHHSEHPEREYDVDEYSNDPEDVYKGSNFHEADVLRHQPGKLTPHLYIVPEGEEQHFTDLGDDRKTTGPDQIMAMRQLQARLDAEGSPYPLNLVQHLAKGEEDIHDHHPDFAWHAPDKDDFPEQGIVHFSKLALIYTADEDLLNKIRDLSQEPPSEHFQDCQKHNRELSEAVEEAIDRGYAAAPMVAMKRAALWKTAFQPTGPTTMVHLPGMSTPNDPNGINSPDIGGYASPMGAYAPGGGAGQHDLPDSHPARGAARVAAPAWSLPSGALPGASTAGDPNGAPAGGLGSGGISTPGAYAGGGAGTHDLPAGTAPAPIPASQAAQSAPAGMKGGGGGFGGATGAPAPAPAAPGGGGGPTPGAGHFENPASDLATTMLGPGGVPGDMGKALGGAIHDPAHAGGNLARGLGESAIDINRGFAHGAGDVLHDISSGVSGLGGGIADAATQAGNALQSGLGFFTPSDDKDKTSSRRFAQFYFHGVETPGLGVMGDATDKFKGGTEGKPTPAGSGFGLKNLANGVTAQRWASRYFYANDDDDDKKTTQTPVRGDLSSSDSYDSSGGGSTPKTTPPHDVPNVAQDQPNPGPGNFPADSGRPTNRGKEYPQISSGDPQQPRPGGPVARGDLIPAGSQGATTGQPQVGPVSNFPIDQHNPQLGPQPVPQSPYSAPLPAPGGGAPGAMGGPGGAAGLLGGGGLPGGGGGGIMGELGGLLGGGGLSSLLGGGGGGGGGGFHLPSMGGGGHHGAARFAQRYFQADGNFLGEGGGDWADKAFAGSGPAPQEYSSSSEDYVDEFEKPNRHEKWHTDDSGDVIEYSKPQQKPKQAARFARQYFYADMAGTGDAGYGAGPSHGTHGGGFVHTEGSGMSGGHGVMHAESSGGSAPTMGELHNAGLIQADQLPSTGYFNPNNPGPPHPEEQPQSKGPNKRKNPGGLPKNPGGPASPEAAEAAGAGGIAAEAGPAIAEAAPLIALASDDSDVVRRFHASGGGCLGNDPGGSFSDDAIASQAQGFMRTAGRKFTRAEERELEDEFSARGARNLSSLRLEGTHYLDDDLL